jgi:hypothetical protein
LHNARVAGAAAAVSVAGGVSSLSSCSTCIILWVLPGVAVDFASAVLLAGVFV